MAVNEFKWAEYLSVFNKDFMNNYNEKCNEGYFLEINVPYSENLHAIYNDLPFLPEVNTVNKVKKSLWPTYTIKKYIIHIRNLKQALFHGLVLEIKSNQTIKSRSSH